MYSLSGILIILMWIYVMAQQNNRIFSASFKPNIYLHTIASNSDCRIWSTVRKNAIQRELYFSGLTICKLLVV